MSRDAARRHAELAGEIAAHDHRYYVLDDPSVTDAAYDTLMRELRALEAAHPELVTPASPSQRVSGEVRSGAVKVRHEHRMFSLDNAYSPAEMEEFFRRVRGGLSDKEVVRFVVEPKLDGGSLEAIYEGGRLVQASTRGDGETGEEITQNVRTVRGVPLTIPHQGKITLRGETLIYRKDLVTFNEAREAEGLEPFANARNAAAGSLRMMDAREVARRPLRILFYQLVEGPQMHEGHAESLEWMAAQGLPTHRRHQVVSGHQAEGVMTQIQAIDVARATYPFETDGAVIKVDSYRAQGILGFTSKFPKWAVAYKFMAERAVTRVRSITVQVGRTGALTPVACLDPVELGGTTVARASLHNAGMIATLDVRVGDRVEIAKAGEIIPQVISVDVAARTGEEVAFLMPALCPECGTPVIAAGAEAVTRCPNRLCPAQVKASIHYFSRRFAMDIDRLGLALVEQLVDRGRAKDPADLYTLTKEQVKQLERMADKSAQNVIDSIERSRERTLDRLLCGLGIPQVGQVAARQLAEQAETLERLVGWGEEEAREQVGQIRGFGPKMVDAVVAYLADPVHREVMGKLLKANVGRPQPKQAAAVSGPLLGSSFCVTGVLSRKREDVHADLRALGATVHDSVKKGTTYLVAGEKTGKTKLDQAKKFGARVIDEQQLGTLLAGGMLDP